MGRHGKILRLALPAIASNITIPLLGLCDTAVSGHLGNAEYLAAIAAGGMMINVVFWLCGFLRMGTTGLTAEAYGAANELKMSRVFSRAVAIALIIGALVTVFRHPLLRLLIWAMAPDAETVRLAGRYFDICILGAPAQLVTMALTGWFIGMQNTLWPMAVAVTVNVVNIAASLSAVYLLGMGFEGVAYGTLTANWLGVILASVAVWRFARSRRLWCGWGNLFKGGELRKFFTVSSDLFFRSACIMGVTFAVTSYGARMGSETLAVNAVMMQFFIFFSYFMDGLAFAGEAMCGKSLGAHDRDEFHSSVKALNKWGLWVAVGFLLVYLVGHKEIVALITDVGSVRDGVGQMSWALLLIPPVSMAAFLYDGFFIGLTATRRMLVTTLAATVVFFAVMLIFKMSNPTLWVAFLSYLGVRGIGLAAQLPHVVRKKFS